MSLNREDLFLLRLTEIAEACQRIAHALERTEQRSLVVTADDGRAVEFVAKAVADLVNAKQLGELYVLARSLGVEPDERSLDLYGCKARELNSRTAADFIDLLREEGWARTQGLPARGGR